MKEFIAMLNKFQVEYQQITDNEIVIPTIILAATEQQGDLLPQDNYINNPLLSEESQIHLAFRNGGIDIAVVDIQYEEE